jgi:ATP-dependent protease ClpP protease subunit
MSELTVKKSLNFEAIYEKDIFVVRLTDQVDDTSIFNLCDEIDFAIDYYHYKNVEIHINSPGGHLDSLLYYLNKYENWKKKNVTIHTTALTSACSAAAKILSLGNIGYRTAYPSSKLVYHYVRHDSYSTTATKHLEHYQSLNQKDNMLLDYLTKHIFKNLIEPQNIKCIFTERVDEHTPKNINKNKKKGFKPRKQNQSSDKKGNYSILAKNGKPSLDKYREALDDLFEEDKVISPEKAKDYYLIDKIKE